MEQLTTNDLILIRDLLNDCINSLHAVMEDTMQTNAGKAIAYRMAGRYEGVRDTLNNIIGSDCKRVAVKRRLL